MHSASGPAVLTQQPSQISLELQQGSEAGISVGGAVTRMLELAI